MNRYIAKTLNESGEIVIVSEPLGKGGEGEVFSLTSHNLSTLPPSDTLVFKRYYEPGEANRFPKLVQMLRNPPKNDSLAWPVALVFDENKEFQGYLMKRLSFERYRPWAEFAHSRERKKVAEDFDLRYAFTSILNFAKAVESVNKVNFFIGDLNESNAFVSNESLVFLVDLDAGQITNSNTGVTYPCTVGKPEYTAPELSHGSFKDVLRTPATEIFALSVASWQMLTGGAHPTDGIYTLEGDPPELMDKIRNGVYPALKNIQGYQLPKRIPVDGIPKILRQLFLSSFSVDPNKRPTIEQFIKVFENVNSNLVQCTVEGNHWYDKRDGECGWCVHVSKGGLDPWASESKSSQISLPSLEFNDNSSVPVGNQRVALNTSLGASPIQSSPMQSSPMQSSTQPTGNYGQSQAQPQTTGVTSQSEVDEEEEIPNKIKGKTVLKYVDGSWDVRPPLSRLFKQDFRTALYCMKNETPSFLKFWWDVKFPIMNPLFGWIGWVTGVIIAVSWFFLVPMFEGFLASDTWLNTFLSSYNVWGYWGIASTITSLFFVSYLLLSGFWDRRKVIKKYGRNPAIKTLSSIKTILRFASISLFYGPLFIVFLIIVLIYLVILLLIGMVRS